MRMKGALVLLCMVSTCGAQKRTQKSQRWDAAEHTYDRTCSNLTQVLDNWKFAIVSQVKDLLINDHASVLPEYNRIQPLSEALGDLYRKFNSLKDELGRLGTKFDLVEAFVDDLRNGRPTQPERPAPRIHHRIGLRSPLQAQMRAPGRRIVRGPTLIGERRKGLQTP